MLNKNKSFLIVFIIGVLLVSLFLAFHYSKPKVVGNKAVLEEINSLLLPVYEKNITEGDFDALESMVKGDENAADEVTELKVLARYHEYTHIGHGLGFLYDHVNTGKSPICPGHSLAHYYVFISHGEQELAEENLEETKDNFSDWSASLPGNPIVELVAQKLEAIRQGNTNVSDEEIDTISDAPCTKN